VLEQRQSGGGFLLLGGEHYWGPNGFQQLQLGRKAQKRRNSNRRTGDDTPKPALTWTRLIAIWKTLTRVWRYFRESGQTKQ